MKGVRKVLIFLSVIILISCSKNDDTEPKDQAASTFMLDGVSYEVGLSSLTVVNKEGISDASIVLSGSNGSKTGGITFLVRFSTADGIEGTYHAGGGTPSPGTYGSVLSVYSIQDGSVIKNGNYPKGELEIIAHGSDEYTMKFNVTYSTDVNASANIKRKFSKAAQ